MCATEDKSTDCFTTAEKRYINFCVLMSAVNWRGSLGLVPVSPEGLYFRICCGTRSNGGRMKGGGRREEGGGRREGGREKEGGGVG